MKANRFLWALLACSAMVFGSCSNDDEDDQQVETAVVSIAGSKNKPDRREISFKKVSGIELSALYTGTTTNKMGKIVVEMEAAPSLVATFNSANGTNYSALPAACYEFESTMLTILDGEKTSNTLEIMIESLGELDYNKEYLLPVTVKTLYSEKAHVKLDEEGKTTYLLIWTSEEGLADPQPGNDRQNWSILGASSEWQSPASSIYLASTMLDGNLNTYWHSDAAGTLPQWVAFDMKVNKLINGFYLTNRQWADGAGGATALPKIVTFEVSDTGEDGDWSLVEEYFELPQQPNTDDGRSQMNITLQKPVTGRYFRFTVLSIWTAASYTYVAEVGIL